MSNIVETTLELKHLNKSYLFLYPTLYLKGITPVQTFLGYKDYPIDYTLICLFHKDQRNIETIIETCKNHKQYDFMLDDQDYIHIGFTFTFKRSLYNIVKEGQYSKIEGTDRSFLLWSKYKEHIDVGLNPTDYYDQFAKDFQCSAEKLREDEVELISPPDPISEYYNVNKFLAIQIFNKLEIECLV